MPTFSNNVSKCYLVSPQKTEIDFTKDDNDNKYELQPTNTLSSCRVRINDLNKDDEGLWSLHAVIDSGELIERLDITINASNSSDKSNENVSSESNSSEGSSAAEDQSHEGASSETVATSEETTEKSSGRNTNFLSFRVR